MKPRMQIRRFDVFAEYKRLEALEDGLDEAHARGYGLWVAKVVASGGGRGSSARKKDDDTGEADDKKKAREPEDPNAEWRSLGDEDQTDALFEQEIVQRMGAEFYDEVFAPAIARAFKEKRRYESIRDSIRKEWKPGP